MSKGKITIIVLVIFMVLAAAIGGIYAYYSINQKEKTDLAAIIASMEKEINKNVETITHLEQTLELNGLELEDLIEKKVEYQTLIDDRTKTQKEYIERKDYITRTFTDKQTIYQAKVEEKTNIEKEIETLTETLNNTDSSEIETITEIQEKIIEKEKEKVVVEQEIQEVEEVIVEYEKELIEVEERINVLTININQLNEMITELNVSVNLIGKTEEETRALVKSLEEKNVALAEELALAKVEIENLKANAEAKYQNIIDNLNSDISNLQSRLIATENELNSYKEANISLQQTIINLENEIEELNSKLQNQPTIYNIPKFTYYYTDSVGLRKGFDFGYHSGGLMYLDKTEDNANHVGLNISYACYLSSNEIYEFKYSDISNIVILRELSTNNMISVIRVFIDDNAHYIVDGILDGFNKYYSPNLDTAILFNATNSACSFNAYGFVFADEYELVGYSCI